MPNKLFYLRSRVFECFLLGGLFVSDQITKTAFLLGGQRYIRNTGGPWGSDIPERLFLILVPMILLGLSYWWLRERDVSARISLMLLLAGGIGNLVDRVVFGYVRDFLLVPWFPAFNPADVFLTIGIIWLFFSLYGAKRGSDDSLSSS
jgi:lipoprotein signal peptidase